MIWLEIETKVKLNNSQEKYLFKKINNKFLK